MKLFWLCCSCGQREPADRAYKHGDSEPCSNCAGEARVLTLSGIEAMTWRCFYCGEVFVKHCDALEHFGMPDTVASTACRVDAKRLREMEALLSRYQAKLADYEEKGARKS
jgi:hypothetical protein